jgi:hypothetical protein
MNTNSFFEQTRGGRNERDIFTKLAVAADITDAEYPWVVLQPFVFHGFHGDIQEMDETDNVKVKDLVVAATNDFAVPGGGNIPPESSVIMTSA